MSRKKNNYRPEWQPKDAGREYAVRIVKGIDSSSKEKTDKGKSIKRSEPNIEQLVEGILSGNRIMLAKSITLVESNAKTHREKAQQILQKIIHRSGNSIRIGITGVPGAGKSTIIESLGIYLIGQGHKVAVLTVDPSSSISKGSILGDKTRMEKLSKESNCFIRPSPSGGNLGGVTRKSRETIALCEAAGYDVILIETVGVGQSEITVRSMVDFFLLIMIAGAGDELQGIKRGIIEIADALVFNKADGDNIEKTNLAKTEFSNALHYIKPITKDWIPRVLSASAIKNTGISEIWDMIIEFQTATKKSGFFEERRKSQAVEWMHSMIESSLMNRFYTDKKICSEIIKIKEKVLNGELLPSGAANFLLNLYQNDK